MATNVFNIAFESCYWENVAGTYLRAGTSTQADDPRVYSCLVTNPTFRPHTALTEDGLNHYVYELDRVGWAELEVPYLENHQRTALGMTDRTMRVIYRSAIHLTGNSVDGFEGLTAEQKRRIYQVGLRHTGPLWDPTGTSSERATITAHEYRIV